MTEGAPSRPAIRPATPEDHAAFAKLFLELEVDEAPPGPSSWMADVMPTTLVADDRGELAGYIFFQLLQRTCYIRNVVVAPASRNRRVGRALMQAVAERARARGLREWRLNVKPDNLPAVRLYERMGMRHQYDSAYVRLAWSALAALPAPAVPPRASVIAPADDAQVETALGLVDGLLADARGRQGRVLLQLRDAASRPCGAAVYVPARPGAFPFRVAAPALARSLLEAMAQHRDPGFDYVQVGVEDDPPVLALLLGAGGELRLSTAHFCGGL